MNSITYLGGSALVVQLDRTLVCEAKGCECKSRRERLGESLMVRSGAPNPVLSVQVTFHPLGG